MFSLLEVGGSDVIVGLVRVWMVVCDRIELFGIV